MSRFFSCLVIFSFFVSAFTLSSCTISITLTDTHGCANDIVDEEASASADVDAKASYL